MWKAFGAVFLANLTPLSYIAKNFKKTKEKRKPLDERVLNWLPDCDRS